MLVSPPKKTPKPQRDTAQRDKTAVEYGDSNPYRTTRQLSHPYDPKNSSNPYAHRPPLERDTRSQRD